MTPPQPLKSKCECRCHTHIPGKEDASCCLGKPPSCEHCTPPQPQKEKKEVCMCRAALDGYPCKIHPQPQKQEPYKCAFCSGKGWTLDKWATCPKCNGSGWIKPFSQPQKQLSECKKFSCAVMRHDVPSCPKRHPTGCKGCPDCPYITPESPKPSQLKDDTTCYCGMTSESGWNPCRVHVKKEVSQLTEEDRDFLKNWKIGWYDKKDVMRLVDHIIEIKDHEAEEYKKKWGVREFRETIYELQELLRDSDINCEEAVKKERKRCAKIADSMDLPNDVTTDGKLGEFYSKAFRHACEKIKSEILNPELPKD